VKSCDAVARHGRERVVDAEVAHRGPEDDNELGFKVGRLTGERNLRVHPQSDETNFVKIVGALGRARFISSAC
jgi:hypothetical protein